MQPSIAGDRSLTLTWSDPTAAAGAAVGGYQVELSTDGTNYQVVASGGCHAPTASPCTRSDLTGGTDYYFRVTAINDAGTGGPSQPSIAVAAVATPDAPKIGRAHV